MEKVTLAVILFVAIFLGFVAYEISTISSGHSDSKFAAAIAIQNPKDRCTTPPGYTNESWRTHMSHHPDLYAECLNNSK